MTLPLSQLYCLITLHADESLVYADALKEERANTCFVLTLKSYIYLNDTAAQQCALFDVTIKRV